MLYILYSRTHLRRTLIKRTFLYKEPKQFIWLVWQSCMNKFNADLERNV